MLQLFRQTNKVEKDVAKKRDEMIERMGQLKGLVDAQGWKDFEYLIQNYIDACKKRKLLTRLDTASADEIRTIQYLDREIMILQFVLDAPKKYIQKVEEGMKGESNGQV